MKIVFQAMKGYRKKLLFLILTVLGTTVCTMGWPRLLAVLVDSAIPQGDKGQVFSVCGLMLLLVGAGIFFGIMTSRFSADISNGIGRDLRSDVFDRVTCFSQTQMDEFSTSSLITRTNSDVSQLQLFLNQCLSVAISAPVMCLVGIALSFSQSPTLSRVLIVSIPVMAVVLLVIGRFSLPLNISMQETMDRINMMTREKLTGARVIRAFGTTAFEEKRFDKVSEDYTKMSKKSQRLLQLVMPLLTVILSLTAGAVMLMAVRESAYEGIDYTTGEVMSIVSYVMEIMVAAIMLTYVFIMLPRASTSARRVKEVLDSVNPIRDPETPARETGVKGTLEFDHVSFTYAGSSVPAVNDLSFKAGPGEITAVIGGTGMGKTSIVNLIPRLYDVTAGRVLVDGVDVREWPQKELREKIGFVPQKANLFTGTIDSNISFGREGADEYAVEAAVRTAQSYDFVMQKEGQFDAPVAQGGSNFSGGQRQRLAIARALVKEPEIYVFDDSFSALDFRTDKALRAALKEQTAGRMCTTVIVAQRISTVMDADRIVVIDSGNIMGIGRHEELMASCPVYREIAESQLGKEAE
ncbi:MAG: ABC transporter ATP-binding protein [Clostridia bacterium]|nr:ABC transporter ATP-binding protein [Clostridia bacterium]